MTVGGGRWGLKAVVLAGGGRWQQVAATDVAGGGCDGGGMWQGFTRDI